MSESSIIEIVQDHVEDWFKADAKKPLAFHNLEHTQFVVDSAEKICKLEMLSDSETEIVLIAAWFHDLGYKEGRDQHEQRGAELAVEFLKSKGYPTDKTEQVKGCILATRMPQHPVTLSQKIICDADLAGLGVDSYFERAEQLRLEWNEMDELMQYDDRQWLKYEIDFLSNHKYHTTGAEKIFGSQKLKNLEILQERYDELSPAEEVEEGKKKKGKKGKDEKKSARRGRGMETMFRTSLRNHISLSAIADRKANILLSICAIIISVTLSVLVPAIGKNITLLVPTAILLTTCLVTIIFATLSTRPKVTSGTTSIQDISQRRSNLTFFGNFYNMELDDYLWGVNEMLDDENFLYNSMIRDLYFLGKVLARKYKFLRISYNVFMTGLVVSVLAFILVLLINH